METYKIFESIAIILIAAKLLGLLARKLHLPQVTGEIIAGLLIGPSILGLVQPTEFISGMASIGVVLLMFSAGLETNLQDIKKTGAKALVIAIAGVFIPLVGGYFVYVIAFGSSPFMSQGFLEAVFIGVILTATSVSITVQTLRELGRLKGEVGTTILSAAIIDDIIGIVVLTFVIGLKSSNQNPMMVIVNTLLFFALAFILGFILNRLFKKLSQHYPQTRRVAIFGLALCFLMAYAAEEFFGLADITGAYVAGIILCNLADAKYIEEKMSINSYMLFGPIFFASIGLKTAVSGLTLPIILFAIALTIVALLTKILGCYIAAFLCRFTKKDSLIIGVGMMNRGEVALIISQKGMVAGLLNPIYFAPVIIMIVTSSILTPIMLKILYERSPK